MPGRIHYIHFAVTDFVFAGKHSVTRQLFFELNQAKEIV